MCVGGGCHGKTSHPDTEGRKTDLREGSGFVREYVLDLAELLIKSGRARARWRVVFAVIHLLIPVDPPTVTEANNLHAERGRTEFHIALD